MSHAHEATSVNINASVDPSAPVVGFLVVVLSGLYRYVLCTNSGSVMRISYVSVPSSSYGSYFSLFPQSYSSFSGH